MFGGSNLVDGGSGNDTIYTGIGNDTIQGGSGADQIWGGNDNDLIYGGTGVDSLYGESGDDTIFGGDDPATSVGGTNAAATTYTVIHLGSGGEVDDNEGIFGNENAGALLGTYGGPGNALYNAFEQAIVTDSNNDTRIEFDHEIAPEVIIIGGEERLIDTAVVYNATVTFTDASTGTFTAVVIQTTDGEVYMMPEVSNNADNILLTSKPIQSISLNSVNTVYTNVTAIRADANYVLPGDGDTSGDYIDGGGGNDLVDGASGDDTILGGSGADTLVGGGANDSIDGGADADSITGDAGHDSLYGGDGNDTLLGGSGIDYLEGGSGDDYMDGGLDHDRFFFSDSFGNDTVLGGEGGTDNDRLVALGLSNGISVTLTGDEAGSFTQGANSVLFSQIEWITATNQADTIDASNDASGLRLDGEGGADLILGGDGADLVFGGSGSDTVWGGLGADTLDGGSSDDDLILGSGDTAYGGTGDDAFYLYDDQGIGGSATVFGGEGDEGGADLTNGSIGDVLQLDWDGVGIVTDTYTIIMTGNEAGTVTGSDTNLTFSEIEVLWTGDGADTIDMSADSSGMRVISEGGNDSIIGGSGNDVIFGDGGNDTISGGDGDDYIEGGAGDDFLTTGLGQDTLIGGDGNDTLMNSAGDDSLVGGAGDDLIIATAGNDTLEGGDGADTLDGGADNDSLVGGAGDDLLEGGTGNDIIEGGDGDDTILYTPGDGNDTITDFNFGNTGTLDDGDSTNNDFVDLSGYYDHISELYADQADDGILNQSNTTGSRGEAVDYSNNSQFSGGSMTFTGASADNSSFTEENTGVVCFAAGTAIRTPRGDVPVETLRAGDMVTTLDGSDRPLLWVGATKIDLTPGRVDTSCTPVRIKPDNAGENRALLVSPQHCLLMRYCLLMRLPDGSPVFARARHLAEETSLASFSRGRANVCYYHLMLDCHDVVISEGRPSETFYPGPQAIKMLPDLERSRLLRVASHIDPASVETTYGPRAATVLTRKEIRTLAGSASLRLAKPRSMTPAYARNMVGCWSALQQPSSMGMGAE